MDGVSQELANYALQRASTLDGRLIIGLAGIPASGKTVLAKEIVSHINSIYSQTIPQSSDIAICIPFDGWHLPRSTLATFPNPKEAFDRRGSHWTFDSEAYYQCLIALRSLPTSIVHAPSFDHALKDPVADEVSILPHHKIVLIEGLYVFLGIEPWDKAGLLLDERWLVEVDEDVAEERLVKRHVATGVTANLAEAKWRSQENDMPNGRFLILNNIEPTRRIQSRHDPKL